MDFDEELLKKIPKDVVKNIKLYRLGVFEGSSYELVQLKKKVDYPPHRHKTSSAVFHFILGEGTLFLDDVPHEYKKGSSFSISKNTKHGFLPKTDSLFLSIQTPPIRNERGEEDIHF